MTAIFSDCRRYRYELRRTFLLGRGRCLFVMLNPSTADETTDDPTIRRCADYVQRWGFNELIVCNIFAWRSTDPAALLGVDDPVGPLNDRHIGDCAMDADRIVVAWGRHGVLHNRGRAVLELLRRRAPWREPLAFRLTGSDQPYHPLYQSADLVPVPLLELLERRAS